MMRYFWNLMIMLDQALNTILGGDPDETLSSRMGKRVDTCILCRFLCNILNKIDKRHCKNSIETDEGSRELFKL